MKRVRAVVEYSEHGPVYYEIEQGFGKIEEGRSPGELYTGL